MSTYSQSLHTTLNISVNPAAVLHTGGNVLFVNNPFKPLLQSIGIQEGITFHADELDMRAASFGKAFNWNDIRQRVSEDEVFTMNIHLKDDPERAYKCRVGAFTENNETFYLMILNDITPQWVLEKKIALRESIVDRIISEFPTVICGLDHEGYIKIWNHRAVELFGYSALEMMDNEKALSTLFPNQRYKYEILEKWNKREENVIRFWHMNVACKDGSEKIISWTVRYRENPIMDGVYHWAIGIDVTAEHKMMEALRQSEERFHVIAKATNDAVWDWDLVNNRLWWSDGVKDLFGYTTDDIEDTIGWWEERIHKDYQGAVSARIHDFIAQGVEFWSDEYYFRRKDGTYAYVFDKGHLIKDESGKPVRFIGGMSDLSDEKAFETLAKMREEQLNQLVETGARKLRPPLSRVMQIAKLMSIMKHERKEVKELADQLVRSAHELEVVISHGNADDDDED